MEQYIPKSALVAEIERLIEVKPIDEFQPQVQNKIDWLSGKSFVINSLRVFLDTIEVKDINLEKELETWRHNHFRGRRDKEVSGEYLERVSQLNLAKHFFELGLKAKDWEKEKMEECPYRQVGCTMYEGKILECRGACSWVVDYPKLKELKVQKGE